jgi:predicted RNase H-like HicB family nuclease
MENLELKIVFVEDPKIGGYTAYFKNIPNVIAEGETKQQAYDNLIELLAIVVEYKERQKYVFVTYDPLYEQVVCVHEKYQTECKKCKPLRKKRAKQGVYHLTTQKFKIKP